MQCIRQFISCDVRDLPNQTGLLNGTAIDMEVGFVPDMTQLGDDLAQLINADSACVCGLVRNLLMATDDVPEGAYFLVVIEDTDCTGEHVVEKGLIGNSKEAHARVRKAGGAKFVVRS